MKPYDNELLSKARWRVLGCVVLMSWLSPRGYGEGAAAGVPAGSRAATLYSQVCVACHGPDLTGGVGPSLVDPFWKNGDHPEAVYTAISKGIAGTEMMAFEAIYSEDDRKALRDFVMSRQVGLRSLVRSQYGREHFAGKRFSPELFKTVESKAQDAIPENLMFIRNGFDGVTRFSAKLYLTEATEGRFQLRTIGRTSIYLDGEEVFFADDKLPEEQHLSKALSLPAGVYEVEIYHEEPKTHQLKFHAQLVRNEGKAITLMGSSLGGSEPKVILAGASAKVIRKKITGISPRALLCLLPNKVMVAYNPYEGRVEKVWHDAEVDQSPSLASRSFAASVAKGVDAAAGLEGILSTYPIRYLSSAVKGPSVEITTRIGGKRHVVTISPEGDAGYTLKGIAEEAIDGFAINFSEAAKAHSRSDARGNFSLTQN